MCRVMMGVAGLAVLGMTATLAGAQTVEVKDKPPLYRYESDRRGWWRYVLHTHWVTEKFAPFFIAALAPAALVVWWA